MAKHLVLFVSLVFAPVPLADRHTLQYIYTVTSGVNSTAVVLLDGEQFAYYDSNISQMIPNGQFGKKVKAEEQKFWNSETQRVAAQQEKLVAIMKDFSDTEGIHTLQLICGCEHDDLNTTKGFALYDYDGEDFFSLDLNNGTWTAVKPEPGSFIKKWHPTADQVKHWKSYLKNNCIDWLHKVVVYGRETLERKVCPKASVFKNHSSLELVCFAPVFFLKSLNITWKKDGADVYKDLHIKEMLHNQDGCFQKRSIVKFPAENLQKHNYTCVIQQSSFGEELVLPVKLGGGGSGRGSDGGLTFIIASVAVATIVVAVGCCVFWKIRSGRSDALSREPQVPY